MRVQSFFVMDENFLLHRKRALRLLERMRRGGKPWSLYVFSSAHTLRRYTMEELVGLGISWLWMGLEGKTSGYAKLGGTDTRALVAELQDNGIRVLGSTIVGLPEHTPEGIDEAIEHAVAPRHRVPPVHAVHAPARDPAARRAPGRGHAPVRGASATPPTCTDSFGSTSGTPASATARRRSSCCGRSAATSRPTDRASSASPAPCCGGGGVTSTTPRSGCAPASRASAQASPPCSRAPSGPRNGTSGMTPSSARRIRGLREELAREFGWRSRRIGRRARPRDLRRPVPRRETAAPGLDLRAGDVLRSQRGGQGAAGPTMAEGRLVPLGLPRGGHRRARPRPRGHTSRSAGDGLRSDSRFARSAAAQARPTMRALTSQRRFASASSRARGAGSTALPPS